MLKVLPDIIYANLVVFYYSSVANTCKIILKVI